jgi:hypothetical protein
MLLVKHNNKKNISLLFICICSFLLTSCEKDEIDASWDGQWQRTIKVPENIQGRCVDETLTIEEKIWHLNAIVHSTFECNQPFLELSYEGLIQEIKIKRETNDRDVRFQVSDIHLAAMFDIGDSGKKALSESMIKTLSDKYVPKEHQFFEHKVYLSKDGNSMKSYAFKPLLDLAIPLYPENRPMASYRRVE